MKRYVLDMAYRHGGKGTEYDLFEVPDGDWVKYEDALDGASDATPTQWDALQARVRELEADKATLLQAEQNLVQHRSESESRLADATALLEDPRMKDMVHSSENQTWWDGRRTFLAGQPAAPQWCAKCNSARPCPGCTQPAAPLSDDLGTALRQVIVAEQPAAPDNADWIGRDGECVRPNCPGCPDHAKPAAPTLTEGALTEAEAERYSRTDDAYYEKPTRTEAEQAVLDAMAEARIDSDGWFIDATTEQASGRAELARRGLKP